MRDTINLSENANFALQYIMPAKEAQEILLFANSKLAFQVVLEHINKLILEAIINRIPRISYNGPGANNTILHNTLQEIGYNCFQEGFSIRIEIPLHTLH